MSGPREAGGEWAGRYEALRAYATGEAPLDFVPLGLALLQHRGVAAWMAAESSATDSAFPERTCRTWQGSVKKEFIAPSSELVRLLAGTVLLVVRGRAR